MPAEDRREAPTLDDNFRDAWAHGEHDQADELNLLADDFRKGRDPSELLYLLQSCDSELVQIGAWIASEIPFDRYNTPAFISKLKELSGHEKPLVRFYALGALFPSFDKADPASLDLICRLRRDDDEGVRIRAEATARSLGLV